MGFLVSPGVQVNEIDLTNIVPAVATTIGAVAGPFEKGQVGEITTISSEQDLVRLFGNQKIHQINMNTISLQLTFYNIQTH